MKLNRHSDFLLDQENSVIMRGIFIKQPQSECVPSHLKRPQKYFFGKHIRPKSKGHQGCGIPLNGGIVNKLFGRGISWSRFIILLGIYLKAFVPTRPMTGSLSDSVLSDEDLISLLKAGCCSLCWGVRG